MVTVNFLFRLFPFASFPQTSQYVMTWDSPRASLYVKCVGYSEGCVPPACVDSQEVWVMKSEENVERSLLG